MICAVEKLLILNSHRWCKTAKQQNQIMKNSETISHSSFCPQNGPRMAIEDLLYPEIDSCYVSITNYVSCTPLFWDWTLLLQSNALLDEYFTSLSGHSPTSWQDASDPMGKSSESHLPPASHRLVHGRLPIR